jgi:site-specific DNA-methyltransferase (adenine-specific)
MREPKSEVYNMDCLPFLRGCKDKQFDLAIVDPPYGIGEGNKKNKTRSSFTGFGGNKKWVKAKDYGGGEFDFSIPDAEYFTELFRVSENQIIWGGNYMLSNLHNTSCFIIWDKENGGCDQADAEIAWTSFKSAIRIFKYKWHGLLQADMKNKEERIHPCHKPIALYSWLLANYAKSGDTILDTHLGSGSSRIAAYHMDFDFTGIELDKEYFDASCKRFAREKMKQEIPFAKPIVEQTKLEL